MKYLRLPLILILVLMLSGLQSMDINWPPALAARLGSSHQAQPQDALNVDYVGHLGGGVFSVALMGNYAYVGQGGSLAILGGVAGRIGISTSAVAGRPVQAVKVAWPAKAVWWHGLPPRP